MASRNYGSLLRSVSESIPDPKSLSKGKDGPQSQSAYFPSGPSLEVVTTGCLSLPRYHFKIFRSKGVLLVLLYLFPCLYLYNFLVLFDSSKNLLVIKQQKIDPVIIFIMSFLLYPVFGWMADVWCGRYKMIKWTLRLLWVFSILSCLIYTSLYYVHSHALRQHLELTVRVISYVLISLSLGGLEANLLQFGVDQLSDASSGEITSFIRWCTWVWFFSQFLVRLTQSCVCSDYEMAGYLLLPTLLTLAVASDFLFNHWLVKEPTSQNPFVLIFRVLRYAVQNKYPRERSAFAYWDDRRVSRIELSKNKYGGPYTTEQVEGVKSFFRIVFVVLICTFYASINVLVHPVYEKVSARLHNDHYTSSELKHCFEKVAVNSAGSVVMTVVLPLFEIAVYPFLKKYFRVRILWKVGLGMLALLLSVAACAVIEIVANLELPERHGNLTTCPLSEVVVPNSLPLDYKWMAVPYFLDSIGQFLMLASAYEFICAQSPYSMKGLLMGFTYGSLGFFTLLGYPLFLLIQFIATVPPEYCGCIFWYLGIAVLILVVIFTGFFLALKCYKRRFRDDSQHNEQIFDVNYYSQHHDSEDQD